MGANREDLTVNCPNCGAGVTWSEISTWRPFCSERCRMIDLGAWFSEERAIPAEDAETGAAAESESGPDPDTVN